MDSRVRAQEILELVWIRNGMSTKITIHTSWDLFESGKFCGVDWHLYKEMNDGHYHLEFQVVGFLLVNVRFWKYSNKND